MKKKLTLVFMIVGLALSCSTDADENVADDLATALRGRTVEIDNVIACAASNEDPTVVSVFVYPRPNATNIQLFVSETADTDKNDFSTYTALESPLLDVFNGFLLKYEIVPDQEKWAIVTFEEEGGKHVSNPIRLKQQTKPTEYLSENVSVDLEMPIMPRFTWQDSQFDDSVIYFHVVSDDADNLLSGTYTFEKTFQYYKLDNVVLNVTEEEPPDLIIGDDYTFSLLAVSEDNWVNLFSVVTFTP